MYGMGLMSVEAGWYLSWFIYYVSRSEKRTASCRNWNLSCFIHLS